jgi:thiol-disulfide isomerase/thioredoxin
MAKSRSRGNRPPAAAPSRAAGPGRSGPPAARPSKPDAAGRDGARPPSRGRTQVAGITVRAPGERRISRGWIVGGVAVVVAAIVAVVVVAVSGGSGRHASTTLTRSAAPAFMVDATTKLPLTVADAVGLPSTSTVTPPSRISGPPLTHDGKPAIVYVGAEYCPYCAAERWAMVIAFSRFGSFRGLKETNSSVTDVYPGTPTFSFYGASYSSPYVSFDPSELATNEPSSAPGNVSGYAPLEHLAPWEQAVFSKYSNGGAFPFIDFANRYLVSGASYSPAVLQGLDDRQIAADLSNPSSPVAQAIVGTATYLTAAVCLIDGNVPASVCSDPVVVKAEKALQS